MKVTDLELPGLKLVELTIRADDRGFFVERYHEADFHRAGITAKFVQDNHSRSCPGTLRGLHLQISPAQGKLVGVVRGRIWDVAVDVRKDSPTYGKHLGLELDDRSGRLLWIPAGFAHGFCVLGDDSADVFYKVDSHYSPAGERSIHWADPDLAIRWPLASPLVSPRDGSAQSFAAFGAAGKIK